MNLTEGKHPVRSHHPAQLLVGRPSHAQAFSHLGLIAAIHHLEEAKRQKDFARLPDHEKFKASVGATVGWRGVIAGFFRVPKTIRLIFSRRSKWHI